MSDTLLERIYRVGKTEPNTTITAYAGDLLNVVANLEWISVDERLPQENVPVIVTAKLLHGTPSVYFAVYRGMERDEAKWWDIESTSSYNEYRNLSNVTHWMPQPEPATTPRPPAPEAQ